MGARVPGGGALNCHLMAATTRKRKITTAAAPPPPPPVHRVTTAGATAACACGWTAGPLRASREVPGAQRALESAAAHLRRVAGRR